VSPLVEALLVGAGGAVGATARHAVGLLLPGRRATTAVNVVGSFLLGIALRSPLDGAALLLVGAGFCGALTTFSSLAVATVRAAEGGESAAGVRFAVGTLLAALVAVAVGLRIGAAA